MPWTDHSREERPALASGKALLLLCTFLVSGTWWCQSRADVDACGGRISQAIPQPSISVAVTGLLGTAAEVGAEVTFQWSVAGARAAHVDGYDFVIFAIPSTVRVAGAGFLLIPAGEPLPFGAKWHPDKLRVVFPLYLSPGKTRGAFTVRALLAGEFRAVASYRLLKRCGPASGPTRVVGPEVTSTTFHVHDSSPRIVVRDEVQTARPQAVFSSPSGEYELRLYEDFFRVLYVASGALVLEKTGTDPSFSPTSRFLAYSVAGALEIIDLLNGEAIARYACFDQLAWGHRDSLAFVSGFDSCGDDLDYDDPILFIQFLLLDREPVPFMQNHHLMSFFTPFDTTDETNEPVKIALDLSRALLKARPVRQNTMVEETQYDLLTHTFLTPPWRARTSDRDHSDEFAVSFARVGRRSEHDAQRAHPIASPTPASPTPVAQLFSGKSQTFRGSSHRGRRGVVLASRKRAPLVSHSVLNRLSQLGVAFTQNRQVIHSDRKNLYKGTRGPASRFSGGIALPRAKLRGSAGLAGLTYRDLRNAAAWDSECEWGIDLRSQSWRHSNNTQVMLVELLCMTSGAATDFYQNQLLLYAGTSTQHKRVRLEQEVRGYLSRSRKRSARGMGGLVRHFTKFVRPPPVKAFLTSSNYLLFVSLDGASIIVTDLGSGSVSAVLTDVTRAHEIETLFLSKDGRFVLQLNRGARFYVHDLKKRARVMNGLYLDDEVVMFTDTGFYEGTTEGARYVSWYYPGLRQQFSFNQFESVFRRPEIIEDILKGKMVKPPPPKVIAPPVVNLTLTDSGRSPGQSLVELNATSFRPVTRMRVFVDGLPVREASVHGTSVRQALELKVPGGRHWITAVAYNDLGFSSVPKSLFVDGGASPFPQGDLYVIGIAVDEYPNMRARDLRFAKRDVVSFSKAVAETMSREQYRQLFRKELLDSDVTPSRIHQALQAVGGRATEKDTVIVYFAGHGVRGHDGKYYLLTADASFDFSNNPGMPWNKMAELLGRVKGKVIVFLDACHSGVASQEAFVANDEYVADLMKSGKAGMAVIAAAKGRQYSVEDAGLGGGHGVFSYTLVRALREDRETTDRNRNGLIELTELYYAVKDNVRELTRGKQTPWLSRNEIIGEAPIL